MRLTTYDQIANLWQDYASAIQAYLLKRVRDAQLAEELAQQVLLKLFDACCADRSILNLRSWMFQIAHHTMVDHYRHSARYADAPIPEWEAVEDRNSIWSEMATCVRPLLGLLPDKYAEPLRLSDLEGMPQLEIAKQLGLGLSATKSRIQRARKLLKEEILKCGVLELDANGRYIGFSMAEDCLLPDESEVAEKKSTDCCVF